MDELKALADQCICHPASRGIAEIEAAGEGLKDLIAKLEDARAQMERQKDEWLSWEAKRRDMEKATAKLEDAQGEIRALRCTEAGLLSELQTLREEIAELRGQAIAWQKQCDTLTHQVICCGVAASHPDATLTTRGAYAGKWNSAQAEEVRKLRADRDQMREERTAWRVTAENAEAAVKQARIDALEEAKQAASAEEILDAEDNLDDAYNCGVLDCVSAIENLKGTP